MHFLVKTLIVEVVKYLINLIRKENECEQVQKTDEPKGE